MALHIKNDEADQLARELSDLTGESLTEVVIRALRERLERVVGRRTTHGLHDEIARIQDRIKSLPRLDDRSDEAIIGYNDSGAPR